MRISGMGGWMGYLFVEGGDGMDWGSFPLLFFAKGGGSGEKW